MARPAGTAGLGAVLDHLEVVVLGDDAEPLHVDGPAEEMDRDQSLGRRRDGGLNLIKVNQIGAFLDVDKDRCGAHLADGLGCGKKLRRPFSLRRQDRSQGRVGPGSRHRCRFCSQ